QERKELESVALMIQEKVRSWRARAQAKIQLRILEGKKELAKA
ncbi:unnamed protein product, partial [marine sediment metagenome]